MYAFYCLHKFHWAPSFFAELPLKEKVVVKVMIDERIKEEKKHQSKSKANMGSSKNVSRGRRR